MVQFSSRFQSLLPKSHVTPQSRSNQIHHSSREGREKEAVDEDRKEVQRHVDSTHQGVIEFPSCAER
ncbi:hypothetical protein AV530_016651 [Patagioenas fasciata monilis]|uniref:Uncharacterized protein n=1 Tax=Patagioenas fasciata monilis TaxID=372326 RepID=A0A1V4J3A5_PATFA|nr:hypothetical protein AV530_016651 [Patagioenas fasciata monilis]